MKEMIVIGIIILFVGVGFQAAFANIMENNPPYKPSNPIPPDGSINVSNIHITLRWTGGDPDGDEVYYNVYFGNYSPPPLIHEDIPNNYIPLFFLELNKTYYWKIVATDEHGSSTPGPIWSFTTTGNSPPLKPTLVDFDNNTLFFYSIDPDGDDIRYHIYWGDGTTDVSDWYPSGEIVGMSHSWLDGKYDIRIIAEDIYGAESAPLIFEIRIGNQAPYPPIINGPQNGIVGKEYTFSFSTFDYEGDNVSFFIEWGDGTSNGWSFYVESGDDLEYKHTWFEQDDYFIRCQAKDGKGKKSEWSNFIIVISKNKAYNFNLLYNKFTKTIKPKDTTPPEMGFVNPKVGYFHVYGVPLLKTILNIFSDTVNIGGFKLRPIQVKSNFEDPFNHSFKVNLRINDEDKGFGTWNPETKCFEWYWTGWAIGEYDLRLRYIDEYGAVYWTQMSVWNLCFFP